MSFAALAWASKQRVGKSSDKLILLAYADRHNEETGCAYPSLAWLCEFSSLNRKTVISSVARLEVSGALSDTGERKGATNQIKVYRVHLETVPKAEQFRKRNSPEKGAKQSQKRDTDTVRTRSKKDKPSLRARAKKPPQPLPDGWEPKPLTPGTVCAGIVIAWQPGRIERELSMFRDHHLKQDAMWSDWDAAWRTWIQRAGGFENDKRTNGMGRHQSGDGLSPTTRAAARVFGTAPARH